MSSLPRYNIFTVACKTRFGYDIGSRCDKHEKVKKYDENPIWWPKLATIESPEHGTYRGVPGNMVPTEEVLI